MSARREKLSERLSIRSTTNGVSPKSFDVDREADELQHAQVVPGGELAEPPAEIGLIEEAGLERQALDHRPRHAGQIAAPPGR